MVDPALYRDPSEISEQFDEAIGATCDLLFQLGQLIKMARDNGHGATVDRLERLEATLTAFRLDATGRKVLSLDQVIEEIAQQFDLDAVRAERESMAPYAPPMVSAGGR